MADVKKVQPGGAGADKKKAAGGGMKDAVAGTENIRNWDEHRIGVDALCARL